MKSDEKLFFCQIYAFFLIFFLQKNGTCFDWQVFFFISEGFEDFSLPKTITENPFNKWDTAFFT